LKCKHDDYSKLAARLCVSSLHKNTSDSFAQTMRDIQASVPEVAATPLATVRALDGYVERTLLPYDGGVMRFINANADELDAMINHHADYKYTYFGIRTLCASYLSKIDGEVYDRPQYMLMRVAIALYSECERDDS